MKRSGPTRALLGLAMAGFVALSGSAALAQEDIYENWGGLASSFAGPFGGIVHGVGGVATTTEFTLAGPRLNPNGIGQFLVGPYYDVRQIGGDAQINNVQFINTNTNNSNLPPCVQADFQNGVDGAGCFNPNGGILAKLRFRESQTSLEVLDFVIALSCGEVWAGKISLNGATGLPQIESRFPVVTSISGASITTQPAFDPNNGGAAQTFAPTGIPPGLDEEDIQRGHFELIAMEAIPCEPIGGVLDLDGNVWSRFAAGPLRTPTNAIGGEIFLVRTAAGVSHAYNLTAISSFVAPETDGITPANPFGASVPDYSDCIAFDFNFTPYDPVECIQQSNLVLSKSRVIGQYDVDPGTAGSTDVILTFPNKYENCLSNLGVWNGKAYPATPFQCLPSGEELVCTIYDRLENFLEEEGGFISPEPPEQRCDFPREVNIIHLSLGGGLGERGDIGFATGSLPNGQAGWVDLDLVRNPGGAVIHREIYPDSLTHDILGVYLQGHQGLPAVSLVLQEYFNGNVGGTYGATVPALYEQVILKPGQS